MRFPAFLQHVLSRWRSAERARFRLDELVAQADPEAELVERNQWLVELAFWLRERQHLPDDAGVIDRFELNRRLRYLLQVLERDEAGRARVARTIVSILSDLDAITLLCDTGLAQRASFWGEVTERLVGKVLPPSPHTQEWNDLLTLLFPDSHDALAIESIDDALWMRVKELLAPTTSAHEPGASDPDPAVSLPSARASRGEHDVAHALRVLASQARATALGADLRTRMELPDIAASPFLSLGARLEEVLEAGGAGDRTALSQHANLLRAQIGDARAAVLRVFDHLEENGISVDIEFRVASVLARLERMELLLELWLDPDDPGIERRLLAELVASHQKGLGVVAFLRESLGRLARKVVDRSAETGDHYITRTRAEYAGMFKAALGGGVVTVATAFGKFAVAGLHLHRLFEGLLYGLNYAGSFVVIYFAHFTLATKQPAMTAPALAAKLDHIGTPDGVEAFVQEALSLMRSQAAAIFGNVLAVVPTAALIEWGLGEMGIPVISAAKATSTIDSFSILGPSPFYAAFTGILLFLSSLISGWADNWFVYRRVGDVIAYNRRLRILIGPGRALAWANFWRRHFTGVTGNVILGFILGMTPYLGQIIAIPLDVRHVTLSSGALATAVGTLGPEVMETGAFWLAVAGIASMAVLNVGVSFFFAFQLALRARNTPRFERREIYAALVRAILRRPLSLLLVTTPGPAAAAPVGER